MIEEGGLRRREKLSWTFELIREDYRANGPRAWARPGFHALAIHRFGRWTDGLSGPGRRPVRASYLALWRMVAALYGIEISPVVRIGRRFVIGHQGAIVIGAAAIGDDCLVRQGVTIGMKAVGHGRPVLGDRVEVGAGAVIVGAISVGDDVTIGPNAVVTEDVPAGSRVFAPRSVVVPPRSE
jgi:serine O-acetyltransferase